MSSTLKNWPEKGLSCRCLLELTDWRYSQSYWYYGPSFVNCCPSNLFTGSNLPPPSLLPCVNKYILYTSMQCERGVYGVLGLRQINTCRKVPLQVNIFRWRHFALPSMSLIFLRLKRTGTFPIWRRVCSTTVFRLMLERRPKQNLKLLTKVLTIEYLFFPYSNAEIFVTCTIKGYLRSSRILDIFLSNSLLFHWHLLCWLSMYAQSVLITMLSTKAKMRENSKV